MNMENRFRFRAWNKRLQQLDYNPSCNSLSESLNDSFSHPYDDVIWLQCTGFKDRLGNLIFEGDIIKHRQGIDKVWYSNGMWRFGNWTPGELAGIVDDDDNFPEIIGNIWEHTHLVKK